MIPTPILPQLSEPISSEQACSFEENGDDWPQLHRTSRRQFLRQGSLWLAGAVVLEEPIKRLWAFPTNPLGSSRVRCYDYRCLFRSVQEMPQGFAWNDAEDFYAAYCKHMGQEVVYPKVWT